MGALDGIRVIEAGLLVAAPQAAATLGDWGADVIKVELPGFGDQSRWLRLAPDDPRSAYFHGVNRGKRGVTVDLRTEAGQAVFTRLAERADVVLTNFKPGTMEAWGLGYQALSARNPGLIFAAASAFGTEGPDAEREGADLSAQAAAGLISTTGADGEAPTPVGITIADHIASQNLVAGILAAIVARGRTGRGQQIDCSLVGGQIWAQASEYTACLLTGRPAGRSNRSHPLVPGLYGIFPTADGWIAVVGVVGAARRVFYETIGRPDLIERFAQPMYFAPEKAQLWPILDLVFAARPTAEWCQILGAAGLRYAPVRDHAQVVADPAIWENGYLIEVDDPAEPTGRVRVVNTPVRFSATPSSPGVRAPELGQHTEEVLLEAGYSWEEIAALSEAGAI
jgi:formyl-CoA transferase/CoA:oxalate CoA-transferase